MPNGKPPINLPKPLGQSMRGQHQKIQPSKDPIKKHVWGSKSHLTRQELRGKLGDQKLFKHGLGQKERVELEKKIFSQQKYGSYITKQNVTKAIKDLQREKSRTPKDEFKIEKQIKTLKDALGEK